MSPEASFREVRTSIDASIQVHYWTFKTVDFTLVVADAKAIISKELRDILIGITLRFVLEFHRKTGSEPKHFLTVINLEAMVPRAVGIWPFCKNLVPLQRHGIPMPIRYSCLKEQEGNLLTRSVDLRCHQLLPRRPQFDAPWADSRARVSVQKSIRISRCIAIENAAVASL